MDLTPELAYYVINFHSGLMTFAERKARSHLIATMKATTGRSDQQAQLEARTDWIHSRAFSSEPDVLELAKDGYQSFQLRTAARILRDSPDQVFLNCCPICGKLARTPTAKQCRHCHHDWHAT